MDNNSTATTDVNSLPTAISTPKYSNEDENGLKNVASPEINPTQGDKNNTGPNYESYPQLSPAKREAILANLHSEKNNTEINAWEENKKANSMNKYNKKLSRIAVWENNKKTTAEARLKLAEEKLEKKRAAYVERMRNELAYAHKKAEEKRAKAEVKKGQDLLKVEEAAADYQIHGGLPKWNKLLQCCNA